MPRRSRPDQPDPTWSDTGSVTVHPRTRRPGRSDETGARWRIGQRRHDQQLIGIGDDDPLIWIGVVCSAPQHRRAIGSLHDPGERVRGPSGRRRRRPDRPRPPVFGPTRVPASPPPGGRVAADHTPQRPRSTDDTTIASAASSCAGRVFVSADCPARPHPNIGLVVTGRCSPHFAARVEVGGCVGFEKVAGPFATLAPSSHRPRDQDVDLACCGFGLRGSKMCGWLVVALASGIKMRGCLCCGFGLEAA